MRVTCCALVVACGHANPLPTPSTSVPPASPSIAGPEWDPLRGLIGTWEGVDHERGTSGRFSLVPDLGGHVLVRRNSDDTPRGRHEDLMIMYQAPTGFRASYFDNEGHVINYSITTSGPHVELSSDEVAGGPRFKLVYDVKGSDELAIDFSIAMPGADEFKHYTGGTVHRVH
jgi:hypothetical protein